MTQSAGAPLDHSFCCVSEIFLIQSGRNLARVGPQPFHELDIPVVMKVARVHSFSRNKFLVPAGIVVICCVERLVQVADKVK